MREAASLLTPVSFPCFSSSFLVVLFFLIFCIVSFFPLPWFPLLFLFLSSSFPFPVLFLSYLHRYKTMCQCVAIGPAQKRYPFMGSKGKTMSFDNGWHTHTDIYIYIHILSWKSLQDLNLRRYMSGERRFLLFFVLSPSPHLEWSPVVPIICCYIPSGLIICFCVWRFPDSILVDYHLVI